MLKEETKQKKEQALGTWWETLENLTIVLCSIRKGVGETGGVFEDICQALLPTVNCR